MVDSDNSDNPVATGSIPQPTKMKRREYGTPVDSNAILPVVLQSTSKFFRDNSPSYLPNEYSAEYHSKKRANRRRIRAKKVANECNVQQEESLNVQTNSISDVTDNMHNLSIKLLDNNHSNYSINIVKNPKEKKKNRDKILTGEMPSKNKSKLPSIKHTKIFTNSNTPEKNSEIYPDSPSNSTPRQNKIRLKNEYKRDSKSTSGQTPKRKKEPSADDSEKNKFDEYLTLEEVTLGLENGDLISGYIRINAKDFKTSYISNPNKLEQDIIVESVCERNRALDGDFVVIKVKLEEEWRSPTQKTGYVVYILKQLHPRTSVGVLKLMPDKNKQYACFHPRDNKVPRMKIPFTDWPSLFYDNAGQYEQVLFLAKIKEWPDAKYAIGNLLENIGMSGDIKSETIAILKENCLDVIPYGDEMKKYFPSSGAISEEEYKYRLDLRKECIFTIDPLTARDLDDAVSCKELPNGNLEIGVHISDVSFYLKEDTPLNQTVSERATSTYMVESVYHMLPKELCMLCSLLPGEDKLAFSVFWEMTKEGKIISHKFSRTVINSCTQLAYEHAQMMLEDPSRQFDPKELPEIFNGYTSQDLSRIVNYLHNIALNLRQGRFDSGALRIDQPKMSFRIDPVSCLPMSYCIYENKECHRLIEEFMLLANITTAMRLKEDYPKIAFLRSHPAPSEIMTAQLQKLLEKVGIHIDISSAGGLQKSLWGYTGDDVLSQARMLVLSCLCAKTMTRAHYFCANGCDKEDEYWHYALSIPIYTHFTSPIRRYADIMVHRLLSGSLGYTEKPQWNVDNVCEVAANCNKQKFNAKRAGEQSLELYLIHYIGQNQPLIEQAVVMEVRATSFDIILLNSGSSCRVYLNMLPSKVKYQVVDENGEEIEGKAQKKLRQGEDKKDWGSNEKKIITLVLYWPDKDHKKPALKQIIALFTMVTVELTKNEKKLKIESKLVRPSLA